jgi:hypothetical protein
MIADEAENDLAKKGDEEVMRGLMKADGGDRRDLKIEFRRGNAMFLEDLSDGELSM